MEPLLRVKEVARALALSPSEVYDMIARGYLPAIRMGRSVRVSAASLLRWLDGKRVGDALLSAETANASADSASATPSITGSQEGMQSSSDHVATTIIIPAFNHFADCTKPLLDRLFGVQFRDGIQFRDLVNDDLDVLVVDDGSTDGTQSLNDYLGTARFLHKAHGGFAAACNYGAAQARGQTLIFLNNDCLPEEGWLAPLLAAVKNRGGIAGSRIVDPDAPGGHLCGGYATASAGLAQAVDGTWSNMNFLLDSQPYEVRAVTGACLAVDRATFFHLGGFDESFGEAGGCEDADLCLRAAIVGLPTTVVPESVVAHREGTTRFAPELLEGTQQQIAQSTERLIQRWGTVAAPTAVGVAPEIETGSPVAAPPLCVIWCGPTDPEVGGSLAIINDAVQQHLTKDHRITVVAYTGGPHWAPPVEMHSPHLWLCHYYDPRGWLRPPPEAPSKLIAIAPWEIGRYPEPWDAFFTDPRFRLLITPSECSRQLLLAPGVLHPDQVRVIPNGFDPAVFCPQGKLLPIQAGTEQMFRVLYVGGLIERKGIRELYRSWGMAFRADDTVRLILKAQGDTSFYEHLTVWPDDADVRPGQRQLLLQDLSQEQMGALYRSCDIVCQPYRAEAFCLPLLEAAACGRFVIAPDAPPCTEYLPPGSGALIPTVSALVTEAAVGGLREVDTRQLAQALRYAYERWQQGTPLSQGPHVQEQLQAYTWEHVAAQYAAALLQVAEES